MKRVISFSVYGTDEKYTIGILKNLELVNQIYPGWTVRIHYNSTVPEQIIKLCEYENVELYNMENYNIPGMFWRFIPQEGVERFISRDADSRLSMREKYAVDEWITSDKSFHIMRDHPHHDAVPVYGGMFGLKITDDFNMEEEINKWLVDKDRSLFNRMGDAHFLEQVVYKHFLDKEDIIAHDSVFKHHPFSKPFPRRMDSYRFVGEIFDGQNRRYPQYQEWINRKEIGYE
jgi:hypothetical protein